VNISSWSYTFSYILALPCGPAVDSGLYPSELSNVAGSREYELVVPQILIHSSSPRWLCSGLRVLPLSAAIVNMSSWSYEFSYVLALPSGSAVSSRFYFSELSNVAGCHEYEVVVLSIFIQPSSPMRLCSGLRFSSLSAFCPGSLRDVWHTIATRPSIVCSVQNNQRLAMVCCMDQIPNLKERVTLVGFPGRVIEKSHVLEMYYRFILSLSCCCFAGTQFQQFDPLKVMLIAASQTLGTSASLAGRRRWSHAVCRHCIRGCVGVCMRYVASTQGTADMCTRVNVYIEAACTQWTVHMCTCTHNVCAGTPPHMYANSHCVPPCMRRMHLCRRVSLRDRVTELARQHVCAM
jgi:hypothetical protein